MFIGTDSTGAACVKITKGDINPFNEPDANASSFLYNSKVAADVKLAATDSTPYFSGKRYFPEGSNANNYKKASIEFGPSGSGSTYIGVKNSYFAEEIPYRLPVFDLKVRRVSDGRYIELLRTRREGREGFGGAEPFYIKASDGGTSAWFDDTNVDGGNLGNGVNYSGFIPNGPGSKEIEKELIVWRLPGDNTPIKDGAPKAPVPGQRSVEITKDFCRVAKPGYDVRQATPTQLAFDSSGRPLCAIGGGDIAIPLGTTQYDLGFPVTANMLADIFPYQNDVVTFPMGRLNTALEIEYWFSGSSIYFRNALGSDVRVRFIVFANDKEPLTTGTNKVFRQFTSGGQNVMQLLRPGAGQSPAFRDIMLDSRWPALQILAEGYQAIASRPRATPPSGANQGQSFSVNFNPSGFLPIVKYMTVHQHESEGKCVKFPQTLITENYNGRAVYHQGNSTYCKIDGGTATFWTFNGNPSFERYAENQWKFDYVPDPIIGIRYYILGIPQ
jgi:hypothetical protein